MIKVLNFNQVLVMVIELPGSRFFQQLPEVGVSVPCVLTMPLQTPYHLPNFWIQFLRYAQNTARRLLQLNLILTHKYC